MTSPRLTVQTVQRLEKLADGNAEMEFKMLAYILKKWGARNLFYVPENEVPAILAKPMTFLMACEGQNLLPP